MGLSNGPFVLAGRTVEALVSGDKHFLMTRPHGENGMPLILLGVEQKLALLFDDKAIFWTAKFDIKYGFPELRTLDGFTAFVSALQSLEDLKRRNGWEP